MTIKAIFSDIDLDANELETEYQASFEQLLWFVNMYLKTTGKGDFTNEEVDVIFNRDMMVNESQVIADINNSPDLSKKTRIAMHPWVDNADEELEQIKKEQEEAIDQYAGAFPQNPIEENGGMSGEE
jgi:SPP1 family phage portal protein